MKEELVMRIHQLAFFLIIIQYVSVEAFTTTPFILTRSQGTDSARWLAGWGHIVNRWDADCRYGAFAIVPEFTQTFNAENITRCFFGEDLFDDCKCPFLKISGSRVSGRNTEKEWLADYFGLPTDFQSIVKFDPQVTNFLIDFNVYLGLNDWAPGTYVNIFAPFVFSAWRLRMQETVLDRGSQGYVPGYFAPSAIARNNLLNNFTEFISFSKKPVLADNVIYCPLERSKISPDTLKKVGFADLHFVLGRNFVYDEEYHIGLNVRATIPTGNRPQGIFLFEPMIGNGHFYELGAGVSGHAIIWRDQACAREWSFYLEAWVTHMFETTQCRSFDLKGADNSRYMLAQLMTENITGGLNGGLLNTVPKAQFNRVVTPLANLTTLPVGVAVVWQADVTLMFNYYTDGLEFDFGYNYWMRRPESITLSKDVCNGLFRQLKFAVKGDSQLFGFREDNQQAVALSATQSQATVTEGLNFPELRPGEGITNPRVNNPQSAKAGAVDLQSAPGGANQINTSIQPILLTLDDLSPCRSSTHGATNSIFGHVNYTWDIGRWYKPYFGIGAKVEIAPEKPDQKCPNLCTQTPDIAPSPCGTCDDETLLQCGLSQWAIWVKAGLSFD